MIDLDGDEGPDPEIGIWGDQADGCWRSPIPTRDIKREQMDAKYRAKRNAERKVSSDFNSQMIYLFNKSRKP
ncbi:MAG: hypothetical protein V4657_13215 [Pseudomonadota bacterium]